jgi:serine/threonine-protein kinase
MQHGRTMCQLASDVSGPGCEIVPLRPELQCAGNRYGDYEVLAALARGGMGGVYLARHIATGERVALKVLAPPLVGHAEVTARLCGECAVSSLTRHPGLVEIRAAEHAADGTPYLVMEYLEGETVAQIAARGRLELAEIAAIGAQAAAALAALHAAGAIHCDVKPDNLFVLAGARWGAGPRIKLIDFGVSRFVDEPAADDPAIAGTPVYMAPEQWRGRPEPASDVYALGCVLYELIAGEPPFEGSRPRLLAAHLDQRPGRPGWMRAGTPAALDRLVLRALAKDPALRPTMTELAVALEALDFSSDYQDLRAIAY